MHAASIVTARHFLMENPTPGSHPLHVAGGHFALVAQAITVFHRTRKNIGNGFYTAVRVPGESGKVIFGPLIAEVVKEQEWIEFPGLPESKSALQLYTGTLQGGLRL
jgi:hypothetical protein